MSSGRRISSSSSSSSSSYDNRGKKERNDRKRRDEKRKNERVGSSIIVQERTLQGVHSHICSLISESSLSIANTTSSAHFQTFPPPPQRNAINQSINQSIIHHHHHQHRTQTISAAAATHRVNTKSSFLHQMQQFQLQQLTDTHILPSQALAERYPNILALQTLFYQQRNAQIRE
jgi:hypothetical protein